MSAYSDRIILDGASHYWRLGELTGGSAMDSVSTAHGAISGGVTLNQPGAISDGNPAMTFDGASGTQIVTPPFVVPQTLTVEAWVKPDDAIGFHAAFSNRIAATTPILVGLNGKQLFCLADGQTPAQINSVLNLAIGVWQHLVFVHTPTTLDFYVNGVLLETYAQTRSGASSSAATGIGNDPDGNNRFWGGLDEVAIYPTALTPATIDAHYALAMPPPTPGRSTRWRIRITEAVAFSGGWVGLAKLMLAESPGGPDTCVNGIPHASSEYPGGYAAAAAFDASPYTYWSSGTDQAALPLPQWLEYDFPQAVAIQEYRLQADIGGGYPPQAWTVEYWNGASWIVVDTQTQQINWGASEVRTFVVPANLGPALGRDYNTVLSAFLPGSGDLTTRITAYLKTLTGDYTNRWKQMEKNAGL